MIIPIIASTIGPTSTARGIHMNGGLMEKVLCPHEGSSFLRISRSIISEIMPRIFSSISCSFNRRSFSVGTEEARYQPMLIMYSGRGKFTTVVRWQASSPSIRTLRLFYTEKPITFC